MTIELGLAVEEQHVGESGAPLVHTRLVFERDESALDSLVRDVVGQLDELVDARVVVELLVERLQIVVDGDRHRVGRHFGHRARDYIFAAALCELRCWHAVLTYRYDIAFEIRTQNLNFSFIFDLFVSVCILIFIIIT